MDFNALFFFVCALGTINCIFFSFYLIFTKTGNRKARTLLAIILLLFSFRIIEQVLLYYVRELFSLYHILWFFAFLSTGPLVLFYIRMFPDIYKKFKKRDILYFLPILLGSIYIFIDHDNKLGILFFKISVMIFLIYVLSTLHYISKNHKKIKKNSTKRYLLFFSFGLLIIPVLYSLSLIVPMDIMRYEAFYISIAIYLLIFAELGQNKISKAADKKYKGNTLSNDGISELRQSLIKHLEIEKAYLNPNINLTSLAKTLHTNVNNISRVINEEIGTSFNTLINQYRIEDAKKMLLDPKYKNQKIAYIAYDCGFSSLSVFNTAFKKITGKTPSKFQKSN